MNLFFLHANAIIAARSQCDKHIVKMLLETAQILSTACKEYNISHEALYKPTHRNHPVVKWTMYSRGNFEWVLYHGTAICKEYTRRYKRVHKSENVIRKVWSLYTSIKFPSTKFTIPVKCMPEECKIEGDTLDSVVQSYRNFYNIKKSRFAVWKYTDTPIWFKPCVR